MNSERRHFVRRVLPFGVRVTGFFVSHCRQTFQKRLQRSHMVLMPARKKSVVRNRLNQMLRLRILRIFPDHYVADILHGGLECPRGIQNSVVMSHRVLKCS